MIVGLTQRVFYHNGQAYDATDQAWYSYFKNNTIIAIKNNIEQDFDRIADMLDILVLTGGNDPTVRRITETKIASAMLLRKKPVVGVCHGAFLLTDLLGGIVDEIDNHHNTEHKVIVNNEMFTVNSFHALRIKQAPPSATVLAIDTDGNCEAWVDGTLGAVVWHPERMTKPFLPQEIFNMLNDK